jgi:adenylate cyclase
MASLLAMVTLLLSPAGDLEHGAGLELLYALRGTRPPPPEVVIITLDSRSARALGQSERPERWPRSLHARLVNGLTDRGARVIGFDVLFERAREPEGDQALAAAIRRAGNVILMEGVSREAVTRPDGKIVAHVDHLTRPLPLLRDAAWASGPFIMPKTPAGIFEFWGFVPSVGDHPSLPMLMAQLMTAGTAAAISPSPDIRLRALNLYGPLGTIRTLSYAEALERVADPATGDAAFRGKAVLIGFSEFNQSRQGDIFRTPYSSPDGLDVSGVELCASALANLLDGSALQRPADSLLLAALLAWSAMLAALWHFIGTARALAISVALGLAWVGVAGWCFAHHHVWLPVILPGVLAPLTITAFGLFSHGRAARQRERDLQRALDLGLSRKGSEKLVALLRDHDGGRSIHGVCLCSDIEAYTSLTENLSPADTRETLNRYFSRLLPVVEAHGGHVMDIVGDSIMCLWLADDSAGDACRKACDAALALHRLMNEAPPVTRPRSLHVSASTTGRCFSAKSVPMRDGNCGWWEISSTPAVASRASIRSSAPASWPPARCSSNSPPHAEKMKRDCSAPSYWPASARPSICMKSGPRRCLKMPGRPLRSPVAPTPGEPSTWPACTCASSSPHARRTAPGDSTWSAARLA